MIELSTSPACTTVAITGDLDLAERAEFPEITARVAQLGRPLVVVDLCATTFLDSTGAAFLTALAHRVRSEGGSAVLRGASERSLFVLGVCGALGLFRLDTGHANCTPVAGPRPWSSTRP